MEKIIEKAREGGYTDSCWSDESWSQYQRRVILDPVFWGSLAEALEKCNCKTCGEATFIEQDYCSKGHDQLNYGGVVTSWDWKQHAGRFYSLNLLEGWDAAIAYLEKAIKA